MGKQKLSLLKPFFLGILLIIIGLLIFSQIQPLSTSEVEQPQSLPNPVTSELVKAKVTRVFDGDTIEVQELDESLRPKGSMARRVRYIGIDTTEVYPIRQCFSDEARIENEKLVLGHEVKLVKDVSETDKYGRLLRYVYVGDNFINDELVKGGYAKVMTIPPDIKYKNLFLESEKYAKENNLGIWGGCKI